MSKQCFKKVDDFEIGDFKPNFDVIRRKDTFQKSMLHTKRALTPLHTPLNFHNSL